MTTFSNLLALVLRASDVVERMVERSAASVKFKWVGVILLFAVFTYKIVLCFQVPSVTADVLRHLGYSSQFSKIGFEIYNTKASDFLPEYWAMNWSRQPYIYPPLTLLFFYFFSFFHLGIFWVKLTLVFIDLACACLFLRHISLSAAILFYAAPVSLWYGAHEGQYEVIQTFLVIVNVMAIKKRRWLWSGLLLAASIQVKQFGILIVPWMLYEMWIAGSAPAAVPFGRMAGRVALGVALGILPFSLFYYNTPQILVLPLVSGSTEIYNPFAWKFWDARLFSWNPTLLVLWNAIFSYFPLFVLISVFVYSIRNRIYGLAASAVPLMSFWMIIKSLKWGQFWYAIVGPGLMVCLPRISLIHLLLLSHCLQDLHSAVALLVRPIGYRESEESVDVMRSCMFGCDPQKIFATDSDQ